MVEGGLTKRKRLLFRGKLKTRLEGMLREPMVCYGHQPTGKLDMVKAEIVVNANGVLKVIQGFIEREKYEYNGDRMPNGLLNIGGVYDLSYVPKRYLDENKNEIKEFIWLSREIIDGQ